MIIGLNGYAGAGKDTVGKYLVDHYQFERLAFADKLKEAAAALLNTPIEMVDELKLDDQSEIQVLRSSGTSGFCEGVSNMTFRHFLQRMGTEMGRNVFGEDFWVDLALRYSPTPLAYAGTKIVVTDVRFDNEAQRIKDLRGYIVRVEARGHVREQRGYKTDTHLSEDGMDAGYVDYVIYNNSTLANLYNEVELLLTKITEDAAYA